MLDRLGLRLQDALDSVEKRAGRRWTGSIALGVALAIGVFVFGMAAFIVAFAVLVELVP